MDDLGLSVHKMGRVLRISSARVNGKEHLVLGKEAKLLGAGNGLAAILGMELAIKGIDVPFDRAWGQGKDGSDFLVGVSSNDKAQDVLLARR